MNAQLHAMKSLLKNEAAEIRKKKEEVKNYQRENNGFCGSGFADLLKLIYDFRHRHIAYCTIRGRAYEEIERHTREDNKPDMDFVKSILEEYETAQAVRPCA